MTSITCENLPGSPSAYLLGGSKVIRGIIARKEGEPGDEAIILCDYMKLDRILSRGEN